MKQFISVKEIFGYFYKISTSLVSRYFNGHEGSCDFGEKLKMLTEMAESSTNLGLFLSSEHLCPTWLIFFRFSSLGFESHFFATLAEKTNNPNIGCFY